MSPLTSNAAAGEPANRPPGRHSCLACDERTPTRGEAYPNLEAARGGQRGAVGLAGHNGAE